MGVLQLPSDIIPVHVVPCIGVQELGRIQCLCRGICLSMAQKEAACATFVRRIAATARVEAPECGWMDALRDRLRVHAVFHGPVLGALRSIPRGVPPVFRGDMHFIPPLLRVRSALGACKPAAASDVAAAMPAECAFTLRLDLAWDSSSRLQAKLLFTDNAPVRPPPATSRLERCRARAARLTDAGWEAPTHCAARFAEFTRDFDLSGRHDGDAKAGTGADARLPAIAAELLATLFDTCNLRPHHSLEVMHFREWCSSAPDA